MANLGELVMTLKADAQPLTKEIERAQKSIKNTTDQLRRESDTFGMSRKEIALYDAAMKGATRSQLAMIAALHDEIEAKKKAAEATKAAAEAQNNKGFRAFARNTVSGLAQIGLAASTVKEMFQLMVEPLQLAQVQIAAEKKLAQAIKSTGNAAGIAADDIKAFAAERQALTNFGDEGTIDAAGVLASFTNVKGADIFKQTLASAQDLSAFLGTDLQSSVMQLGKSLNDPARGMSALAESGIQFSKSQQEQIKRLQEIGDLAGAQKVILAELQTQFGGQAQAMVDPLKQVSNAFGDMKEEIGVALQDIILPLLPKVTQGFKLWGEQVKAMVGYLTQAITDTQSLAFIVSSLGSGMSLEETRQAYHETFGLKADQAGVGGIGGALKIGMQKKAEKDQIASDAAAVVKNKEVETAAVFQAEKVMAGFVRSGLESLTSGYMSLGPQAGETKSAMQSNQVGSLEKGSREAMDTIRANVGQAGKDDIAKKQLETQQKMEKHMQQMAKQFGHEWTPGFKIWNIES